MSITDKYALFEQAQIYLHLWATNQINKRDFYTHAEVDVLAEEVITDHNRAAALGQRFRPPHYYRTEQVMFAQYLPSIEVEDVDGFTDVRSVVVERMPDEQPVAAVLAVALEQPA